MKIIEHIKHSTILKRKPLENRNFKKVFCVGWLKTGTSSMGKAIKSLGFKHLGYDEFVWREWYSKNHFNKLVNYASFYESFDDLPWNKPELYPHLNKAFPNSKYLLTIREPEAWFDSLIGFNKKLGKPTDLDKGESINQYLNHNKFYKEQINPENLLEFDIFAGDSIKKLADFLEVSPPKGLIHFPHENKT